MSEIKRYRLNAMEFIDRKGWEKQTNTGKYHIHEQRHKKGGWCKWSDVAKLQKEKAELAEAAEQMLEMLVNNAPIEGLYPSTIDEWDVMINECKGGFK